MSLSNHAVTNHIQCHFDYDAFDAQYTIYKITTDEDYISWGSRVLDLPALDGTVKAVSFNTEDDCKVLYAMLPADQDYTTELQTQIRNAADPNGHLTVWGRVPTKTMPDFILLRLLRNALGTPLLSDTPYSCLTSKLLLVYESLEHGDILACLSFDISRESNLILSVVTFVSKNMDKAGRIFYDTSSKKTCWEDYTHYMHDKMTNTMRLALPHDKGLQYIQRTVYKDADGCPTASKHTMNFLNLFGKHSYSDAYNKSKVAYLYQFLNLFNEVYDGIVHISLSDLPVYQTIKLVDSKGKELSSTEAQDENIQRTKELLPNLTLVDLIGDEESAHICQELKNWFEQPENGGTVCTIETDYNSSMPCLALLHEKDYYTKTKNEDVYKNAVHAVQHITLETARNSFKYYKKGTTSLSAPFCHNIRNNLLIKQDVMTGMVSAIDLTQFAIEKDWVFGVRHVIKIDKTHTQNVYSLMTLHPDHSFSIQHIQNLWDAPEDMMDMLARLDEEDTECVIQDEAGHLVSIKPTETVILPDGDTLVTVLEHIDEYNRKNPNKRAGLRGHKPIMLDSDYPIENPQELYLSISHLNYCIEHGDFLYWAGIIAKGANSSIPRAVHVRRIQGENAEEIGKRLLPTYTNILVRNGQFSVLPFVVKYIRESWDIAQRCDI